MVGRKILHNLFGRILLSRALDLKALNAAIEAAEAGHSAEIAVSVAHDSPILSPLHPRDRAVEAFSVNRVWDTENNSGVLLFFSLADKAIEVVADRGAAKLVSEEKWAKVCSDAAARMKNGESLQSTLELAIAAIGDELRAVFPGERASNQLPDSVNVNKRR